MKIFDIFDEIPNLEPCISKVSVVGGRQMTERFRIKNFDGTYQEGYINDYLVKYSSGELKIYKPEEFSRKYRLEVSTDV